MTREQLIKALHDIAASEANPMLKSQSAHLFAAAEMLKVDGAPVAWRWVWKSRPDDIDGWCYTNTPPLYPNKQIIEPLYTAPQPAMSWQPIETAPKDGTDILIYSKGNMAVVWWAREWDGEEIPESEQAWYVWDGKDALYGARRDLQNPTHWMPLPPAPGAAPQPAIQERKPLTDEQIRSIKSKHDSEPQRWPFAQARYIDFARAIEAAHGITENKP